MREGVFYQPLMVALALLGHFDDPYGQPFTGNRRLCLTGEQTAGFWTASQAASNALPKIATVFGSKASPLRNGTIDIAYRLHRRYLMIFDQGKRHAPTRSGCRTHSAVTATIEGTVGNVDYRFVGFIT